MWMDEEQKPVENGQGIQEMSENVPDNNEPHPVEEEAVPSPAIMEEETIPLPVIEGISEVSAFSDTGGSAGIAEEPALPADEEPVVPASAEDHSEEMFSMEEAIEQSFKSLEERDIIEATVVQVDREGVLVDVGTKSEVAIPLEELTHERRSSAEGLVAVGDKIRVMVMNPYGKEGPVLSKREADFENLWDRIEDAHEKKETMHAMVIERVKGGLVVDLGVRGFIPASHVGLQSPPRDLDRLVGKSMPIKLLNIDREKRKVVASNREAEEEMRGEREAEREQQKRELFARLSVGDVLPGVVKRLTDYGAFVDIGGFEGLLHVSEMSWTRVENPRDVLKVGDAIQVKVLRLEPDKGKVSLGMRQVLPDPWAEIPGKYYEGATVEATVSRVVRSGAFARLPEGVEAFIPIAEISHRRIKRTEDALNTGQVVNGLIIELNASQRRMVLSLRAMMEQTERKDYERHKTQARQGSSGGSGGSGTSGFTIGDRLQGLKSMLGNEEGAQSTAEADVEETTERVVEESVSTSEEIGTESSVVEEVIEEEAIEETAASEPEPQAEESQAEETQEEMQEEAGTSEPDDESKEEAGKD
jgi:ribosomal protein S1